MSLSCKHVGFVSAYGDREVIPGVDCSNFPALTKQEFAEESDINNIMARYNRTQIVDWVNEMQPRFDDATAIDYQQALNVVIAADQMFGSMPGELRQRFSNDPAIFLSFIDNPENDAEAIKLGLKIAPPAPPLTVPVPAPSAPVVGPPV